jgi:hypothetical protein
METEFTLTKTVNLYASTEPKKSFTMSRNLLGGVMPPWLSLTVLFGKLYQKPSSSAALSAL